MQLREYEMALAHTPVLLDELLELLRPARGEVAIDCTFGAGGHAEAVAAALGATGHLIAIDRDPSVAEYFRDVARAAPCACELYHGNFAEVLAEREPASADVVYMDLGVSSMQLDRRERGFSYAYDAPLDMRMDPELEVTADDDAGLGGINHGIGQPALSQTEPCLIGGLFLAGRVESRLGARHLCLRHGENVIVLLGLQLGDQIFFDQIRIALGVFGGQGQIGAGLLHVGLLKAQAGS